ncbi:uncharacterized protein LOC135480925 [Liolophura sinensis]|uniref:uncharacterized protein LOC135480925 n=1 Tax=Liolophura sinensis TaxID=3198878 RepID=UPI003158BB77
MNSWRNWLADLHKLEEFHIPRRLAPVEFGKILTVQLHHFSDASCEAYGVASYIRVIDVIDEKLCTLALAKSRLAPAKTQTIPRLELTAAVLATKMADILRQELQLEIDESTFWTDSEIVLRCIKNEDKRFHTFVANRVGLIHSQTIPSQWKYISSVQNPEDDASRGLSADELLSCRRWQNGPDLLWSDSTCWPDQPNFNGGLLDDEKEIKKDVKVYRVSEQTDSLVDRFLERCSSWYKLKKSIAWVLRLRCILLRKIRNEDPLPNNSLTVAELHMAEEEIVKVIQRQTFSKELSDFKAKQEMSKETGRKGITGVRILQKAPSRPEAQRMADLRSDRITPGKPPFTCVGVDCFGPFMIKRGRSRVKRCGYIFTCLTIRAIHVEKLDSMNTDSFINALKRFESRRGKPEKIRSNNGTNFTSAEKELS